MAARHNRQARSRAAGHSRTRQAAVVALQVRHEPSRSHPQVVAQVVADDHSSDQQFARVNILRYLNIQLSRALAWADDRPEMLFSGLSDAPSIR